MSKELKRIICKSFESKFGDLQGCVLVDYRGIDSEKTLELRGALRKQGVTMSVLQNRLAKRVFSARGLPTDFQALLKGPTAVLVGADGAVSASKSIVQWRKKNKELAAIKGGLLQGKTLSAGDVEHLALLPDKDTQRANVLGVLLGPLNFLATVTQSVLGQFAGTMAPRRESLEKGEGGAQG